MNAKTNIAARAAKWSATHRKVAIFGWLAFVVVSVVVGGAVGAEAADRRRSRLRRGRPRRGRARTRQARPQRARWCWSRARALSAERAGLRGRGRRSDRVVWAMSARSSAISSPAGGGGQVSADGHSALIEFQVPGDDDQAEERVDASLAATAADATQQPRPPGRAVRRRQRQQGARRGLQRRPREGGDDLAADHAADPAAGLRSAGRGPGAAADRVLGGGRDDRPAGACRASWCRWTPTSPRWSSWSGSRSASTTRCSICAASAKSGGRVVPPRRRSKRRRRPRAGLCSSRD